MHRLSKLNNASQQKHTLNPISDTAFFTCGARAADARAVIPVCGDFYAERFLDKHGCRIFEGFKRQTGACAGIVARHRIIDDLLRDLLVRDPATSVIVIGAGFDSRAFRLLGGDWTELDESSIIDLKNLRLPVAQWAWFKNGHFGVTRACRFRPVLIGNSRVQCHAEGGLPPPLVRLAGVELAPGRAA